MSRSDKDEEYSEDEDFSISDEDTESESFEIVHKQSPGRKATDALRRIEEYRSRRELKNQVEFFDEEWDGDDIFSEL